MSEPASNTALNDEITAAGQQMADDISETATQQAHALKADAASEVAAVAEAAEAARDSLPENHVAEPVLDQAVHALGHVAEHLKTADIDALTRQASDFARRNPALVLGGAALVGFAAARFLKAGPHPDTSASAHDPWANHLERS